MGRKVVFHMHMTHKLETFLFIYIKSKVFSPHRQTGIGVSSMLARIGGVLAPMINLLGETNSSVSTAIFGFAPLLGAALALGLPETANKPLPDTIQDIQDAERLLHACNTELDSTYNIVP